MRHYSSFLVRWWQVEAGQQRLNIRHIQSSEELTVTLLADALDWMAACVADADRAPPVPHVPDPGPPRSDAPPLTD